VKCVDGHCGCTSDEECIAASENYGEILCKNPTTGEITNTRVRCSFRGENPTYRCEYCGSCKENSHCKSGSCCENEIGIDVNDDSYGCIPNGVYKDKYICYHKSPSRWIVCNEENLNKKVEVNNITYTCVNQNGNYSWITGYTTKQNKANLFELIINFFKNLFNFLKSE
jgi:hypothetical protein